ncbi:MAG: LCP family protein [Eubacterium sp.]|nr:LCP family protein [Eubacterium sp.]
MGSKHTRQHRNEYEDWSGDKLDEEYPDEDSYLDLDLDRYADDYARKKQREKSGRSSGRRQDHNDRRKPSDSSVKVSGSSGRKRKKGIASVLSFLIAMIITGGLLAVIYAQGLLGKINFVSASMNTTAVSETFDKDGDPSQDTLTAQDIDWGDTDGIEIMKDQDIKNILLIGQDARSGESGQRSDSMILCSINTKENKIKLVSLMRDMYVQIPGYQANKLNAAYSFGGMTLLDKTIEQNFGAEIDGNVEVDFDGFLEALTEIGNLDIELSYDEATYMNANEGLGSADDNADVSEAWGLKEGVNTLTPNQVLCYARMRYVGNSDYDRTERQKKVIMAAYQKVQNLSTSKLLSLASKIFPCITTDLSKNDLLSIVKTLAVNKITTVETYRLPVDGTFTEGQIDDMSVLVPNLDLNSAYLQNYLYGKALPDNLDELLAEVAEKADSINTSSDDGSYSSSDGSLSDNNAGYSSDDNSGNTYNTYNSDNGGMTPTYDNGGYSYDAGNAGQDNTYYNYNGTDNSTGTDAGYSDPSYYGNSGQTGDGTVDYGEGMGTAG